MKLEEGKFYRTKAGRKIGPMRKEGRIWDQVGCLQVWHGDGRVMTEIGDESHDYIVAEWEDDTPKLWRDMTPEEKGALLLAHHEGKVIETSDGYDWFEAHPDWAPNSFYRVRPEPKRETVTAYWGDWRWTVGHRQNGSSHRITFELIDGKPDVSSVKMEAI